jgi:hypothetical protein
VIASPPHKAAMRIVSSFVLPRITCLSQPCQKNDCRIICWACWTKQHPPTLRADARKDAVNPRNQFSQIALKPWPGEPSLCCTCLAQLALKPCRAGFRSPRACGCGSSGSVRLQRAAGCRSVEAPIEKGRSRWTGQERWCPNPLTSRQRFYSAIPQAPRRPARKARPVSGKGGPVRRPD